MTLAVGFLFGGIIVKQISKPRNFLSNLMSPVSPCSINSSCFIFVPSLQFMLIFLRVTQCLPFLQEILEIFLCFDQLRYWILGTPSKSHHQDDIPILRLGESQAKPSLATITGRSN